MIISFDLDEVLFVDPARYETEPPLRFPLDRLFPERLRKGTVQLIRDLQAHKFQVWVYTSSYRTETYIRSLFRHYGIRFDFIVNGFRHDAEVQGKNLMKLPTKLPSKYHIALHIDDEEAVIRNGQEYGFRVMRVYEPDPLWAQKIMDEACRLRERLSRQGRA